MIMSWARANPEQSLRPLHVTLMSAMSLVTLPSNSIPLGHRQLGAIPAWLHQQNRSTEWHILVRITMRMEMLPQIWHRR